MNKRFLVVLLALDALLLITGVAIYQFGLVGFIQAAVANSATLQVLADLTIAMTLFCIWMWQDAKDRGVNPIPYVVAIVFLGSIGALSYLLGREWRRGEAPASATRIPAAA